MPVYKPSDPFAVRIGYDVIRAKVSCGKKLAKPSGSGSKDCEYKTWLRSIEIDERNKEAFTDSPGNVFYLFFGNDNFRA